MSSSAHHSSSDCSVSCCPPTAISASDCLVTLLSKDGSVSQGKLDACKSTVCFESLKLDCLVPGCVTDVASTNSAAYLLTKEGRVYEVTQGCGCPSVREICIPQCNCKIDPVVQIKAGPTHVVMLTKNKKVYGLGDNRKYQLVPQGECEYNYAVPIIITDKLQVDSCNKCDDECEDGDDSYVFQGTLQQPATPVVPADCSSGAGTSCSFAGTICGTITANVNGTYDDGDNAANVVTNAPVSFTVCIPVFGQGSLCGTQFTGTILFSGPATITLTTNPTTIPYNVTGTVYGNFVVVGVTSAVVANYTSLSGTSVSTTISDECASTISICIPVTLTLTGSTVQPFVLASAEGSSTFTTSSAFSVSSTICAGIPVNCPITKCTGLDKLPIAQPCWANVYAGKNGTVLVDTLGRFYVLGNLSSVRDNLPLLRNNCMEDLLRDTKATVKFPAGELKCPKNNVGKGCGCGGACGHPPRCTDLSKFQVELELTPDTIKSTESDCDATHDVYGIRNKTNVCDFLKRLKKCNETPRCEDLCEPCDNTIKIRYGKGCSINEVTNPIILLNHKSVDNVLAWMHNPAITSGNLDDLFKLLSGANVPPFVSEFLDFDYRCGRVEYNNCEYFTDSASISTSQVVVLNPGCTSYYGNGGQRPNGYFLVYLDVECDPRVIQMTTKDPKKTHFNIRHTLPPYTSNYSSPQYLPHSHFAINFGGILGSVELNNFKAALGNYSYKNSPCFKNPISNKIYFSYVQPTDLIILDTPCGSTLKAMAGPDTPLVFNLNKKIGDVAIDDTKIAVLATSVACPSSLWVLGRNCDGELSIGSNRNTLCFQKVNNCFLNSPPCRVWLGDKVMLVKTVCGALYGSGERCGLVRSDHLVCLQCPGTKCKTIKSLAITSKSVVVLTTSGCVVVCCGKVEEKAKCCPKRECSPKRCEPKCETACERACRNVPRIHPVLARGCGNFGPINLSGNHTCRCVGKGCKAGKCNSRLC